MTVLEAELPPLTRSHRILCVDDDPPVLRALGRLLRREPYEATLVKSADEALEALERDSYSLIVSDQRMSPMSGTDLLLKVRRHWPGVQRMLLTAYASLADPSDRAYGGVQRLVRKPWNDVELKRSVRELLREQEGLDASARLDALNRPDRDLIELVASVPCKGRTVEQAIETVTPILTSPEAPYSGALIVLGRLRKLNGSVTRLLGELAESAEDAGVRTLLLDPSDLAAPYFHEAPATGTIRAPSLPPGSPDRRRLLLVGASHAVRAPLALLSAAAGMGCDEVGSPPEAADRLGAVLYERILLDLELPDLGSFEIVEWMAHHDIRTPVVLLSATMDLWAGLPPGSVRMETRISKPYGAQTVLDVLQRPPDFSLSAE